MSIWSSPLVIHVLVIILLMWFLVRVTMVILNMRTVILIFVTSSVWCHFLNQEDKFHTKVSILLLFIIIIAHYFFTSKINEWFEKVNFLFEK